MRKPRRNVNLAGGNGSSRQVARKRLLSKGAWASWLGFLAVCVTIGVASSQPASYYTVMTVTIIAGITSLWVVDRILQRKKK